MYRVQKKRKGILFYLLLFLCAFSVGLGIGYAVIQKKAADVKERRMESIQSEVSSSAEPPEGRPALAEMIVEEVTPITPGYFVVAQGESVCVFLIEANGNKRFSHKLGIELEALPPVDQQLFQEGIYLYSKEELMALTEDFTS